MSNSKPVLLMMAALALTGVSHWVSESPDFGPFAFLLVFTIAVLVGDKGIRMSEVRL